MEWLVDHLSWSVEQLLGRASGPLHFRLFVMPTVVTILAIRAGLRDARENNLPFLVAICSAQHRQHALRTALKDIGRVIIMAITLDTIYQALVLNAFYPGQLVIVVVACSVLPYLLIRGPVARVICLLRRSRSSCSGGPAGNRKQ